MSLADERPITIDREGTPGAHDAVLTSARAGEILLVNEAGTVYRPRWAAGQAGERRVIPAGAYRVAGYRAVEGGWFVSTTGGGDLVLAAGEVQAVDLDPTIHIEFHAGRDGAAVNLGVGVSSGSETGLSIYREGHRIPLTVVLEGAGGATVASGDLHYG